MIEILKWQIVQFLRKFKSLAQQKWVFIKRKKNLDSLASLGITVEQAKSITLGLSVSNYSSGPEKDTDREGQSVWTFCALVNEKEVYIKLSDDFSGNQAKCISFHQAERPMKKPLSKEGISHG